MKLVSACLAGKKCFFEGIARTNDKVVELVKQGHGVLVCPEQLGGLPTPRPATEIKGDKVLTVNGKDVTKQFKDGAKKALEIAKKHGCKEAILKQKSPSCGCGKIFDGTFTGTLIKGDGVFCELLKKHGIKVISEEDL